MHFPHITHAALTDVGRKRKNNEDAFGVFPEAGLFCVSDGMGGGDDGEIASSATIRAVEVFATENKLPDNAAYPAPDYSDGVQYAVNKASAWIAKRTREKGLKGCGSTFVALCLDASNPTKGMALHAGDSRLYRIRGKSIQQITRDHSAAELIGAKSEADVNPMFRGMILRAVGIEPAVELDMTPFDLKEGDRVLICSDGLSRMVKDKKLLAISLANKSPGEAVKAFVAAANEEGGIDNVTAIVVDFGAMPAPLPVVPMSKSSAESRTTDASGAVPAPMLHDAYEDSMDSCDTVPRSSTVPTDNGDASHRTPDFDASSGPFGDGGESGRDTQDDNREEKRRGGSCGRFAYVKLLCVVLAMFAAFQAVLFFAWRSAPTSVQPGDSAAERSAAEAEVAARLARLEREKGEMEDMFLAASNRVASVEKLLTEVGDKCEALCKELSQASNRVEKAEKDVREFDALSEERRQELEKRQKEFDALKSVSEALGRDKQSLASQNKELNAALLKLEKKAKDAEDRNSALQREKGKLERKARELSEELQKAGEAAASAKADSNSQVTQLATKDGEIADLLAQLAAKEGERQKIQAELDNANKQLLVAQSQLAKAEAAQDFPPARPPPSQSQLAKAEAAQEESPAPLDDITLETSARFTNMVKSRIPQKDYKLYVKFSKFVSRKGNTATPEDREDLVKTVQEIVKEFKGKADAAYQDLETELANQEIAESKDSGLDADMRGLESFIDTANALLGKAPGDVETQKSAAAMIEKMEDWLAPLFR